MTLASPLATRLRSALRLFAPGEGFVRRRVAAGREETVRPGVVGDHGGGPGGSGRYGIAQWMAR